MTTAQNEFSARLAIKPFRELRQFRGRSTRTELISFGLLYMCAVLAMTSLSMVLLFYGAGDWVGPNNSIALFFFAAFWLPTPALIARRLQDVGWPGILGALFVAGYGAIVIYGMTFDPLYRLPPAIRIVVNLIALALFVAALWSNTPGSNRYGPNPRLEPQSDELGQE